MKTGKGEEKVMRRMPKDLHIIKDAYIFIGKYEDERMQYGWFVWK